MSTSSPQAEAAGDQAQWQAQLARQLSGIAQPELQKLVGGLTSQLQGRSASGQLTADAGVLSSATNQLNQGYGQAGFGSREAIGYGALRSGEANRSPGAVNSSVMNAATSLDRDRTSALRNLQFQSAQSSMADYNQVLQLLGQGTQSSLGLAQGFSGASGQAIGGLSNQSDFSNILGGVATGVSILGAFA